MSHKYNVTCNSTEARKSAAGYAGPDIAFVLSMSTLEEVVQNPAWKKAAEAQRFSSARIAAQGVARPAYLAHLKTSPTDSKGALVAAQKAVDAIDFNVVHAKIAKGYSQKTINDCMAAIIASGDSKLVATLVEKNKGTPQELVAWMHTLPSCKSVFDAVAAAKAKAAAKKV